MRRELVFSVLLLLVSLLASDLVWRGHAIWFELPATGTKCVSDELRTKVVVIGRYVVQFPGYQHSNISIDVTTPFGNVILHKDNITHDEFAFTTQEAGQYQICFWADGHNQAHGEINIFIDWETGIDAKDWDAVAKKEKLEGVELELKKLEAAVEAIFRNIVYLKHREAQIRTVSEDTNKRVAVLSWVSFAVCIVASFLQVMYLRRYFRKKKLI